MIRAAVVIGVVVCLLPSVAGAQQNYFRPLHLKDMVKAVGTNDEGMPPEELPKRITTYALHISDGDGVGVSARFAEDPDGAIIVGWRAGGRLWHYAWVESPGLGVLEVFKPVGDHFAVETRHKDGRVVSVVLDGDLSTIAVVQGQVTSAVLDTSSTTLTIGTKSGETTRVVTCRPPTADTHTLWRCTDSATWRPAT
jgi:hypothetical protein